MLGASLLIGRYVPVVWCRRGAVAQLWLFVVELHCWIVWKPSVLSLSDDGVLFYLIDRIFQVQAQRWYICVYIQLSITGFVLFRVLFWACGHRRGAARGFPRAAPQQLGAQPLRLAGASPSSKDSTTTLVIQVTRIRTIKTV